MNTIKVSLEEYFKHGVIANGRNLFNEEGKYVGYFVRVHDEEIVIVKGFNAEFQIYNDMVFVEVEVEPIWK